MQTVTSHLPRPLANAPIPLLADDRAQLSFGERAALEGILRQLKPSLSVEVGSAAGGTLQRIAAQSGWVHSFDLVAPDEDVALLVNVVLHTGDSRALLPRWLWNAKPRLDFAFIDGDHTPDGVQADLRALLGAPVKPRVILLHDTANPAVRDGIDSVGLDGCECVVYHEIDFVPGAVFAEGPFAGERWGGLGLVVTGDRSSEGYGCSPAQTLYQ